MSADDRPLAIAPRLATAFAAPRAERAALIPYFTGGYPDRATSHVLVAEAIAAGADIVELGVPYSDPVADGPVVQRSAHRALLAGTTTDDVLAIAAAHAADAPFVLLAYVNSVLAFGPDRFFARAAASGVEGVVIPDLPADEMRTPCAGGDSLLGRALAHGVALIPLATPPSTDERLDLIVAAARAFVYCVAVVGVTGPRRELGDELPSLVARLRTRTAAPLVAGFGISTPRQVAEAAAVADGVIIGSALIAAAEDGPSAATALIRAAADAIAEAAGTTDDLI